MEYISLVVLLISNADIIWNDIVMEFIFGFS